jgi:hypothetical protein
VSGYGLDEWAIEVRSPAEAKGFFLSLYVQTGSGAHAASCTMGTGVLSPGLKRSRGMTLTTHHHLMPRSRMSRRYTSSPPNAFISCSGTALAFSTGYRKSMVTFIAFVLVCFKVDLFLTNRITMTHTITIDCLSLLQWYSTGGTRRHLRGYVDYTICITCIIYQQLWGYKVEEKLYLGVREQKRLNATGLLCLKTLKQ